MNRSQSLNSEKKKLFILCVFFLMLLCFWPARRLQAFCFDEAAKTYGINAGLLRSIAKVESGMRPTAINRNRNGSTDLGLMQINSSWIGKRSLDKDKLLTDPCYNVMTGASILKGCIDAHGYTWEAVGCYNAYSRGKRMNYSWKIYRQLKKEGARGKETRAEKAGSKEAVHPKKSLHFRVIEDRDVGTEEP